MSIRKSHLSLQVNGEAIEVLCEPRQSLLAMAVCVRLSRSFEKREGPRRGVATLINKRHQPFSAPHVIGVLRAKRTGHGIFLHVHAVNESHADRQKYDKQRGPVTQRQS